jgi:DNA invertase Pin-like site-specific DNA recombinase
MPTRVAIYARVSTVNHGQDVSLQTRELRQFAEARGWIVAGEYIDSGVSGAKDSRPELNRQIRKELLGFSVFGFGFFQDGNVRP